MHEATLDVDVSILEEIGKITFTCNPESAQSCLSLTDSSGTELLTAAHNELTLNSKKPTGKRPLNITLKVKCKAALSEDVTITALAHPKTGIVPVKAGQLIVLANDAAHRAQANVLLVSVMSNLLNQSQKLQGIVPSSLSGQIQQICNQALIECYLSKSQPVYNLDGSDLIYNIDFIKETNQRNEPKKRTKPKIKDLADTFYTKLREQFILSFKNFGMFTHPVEPYMIYVFNEQDFHNYDLAFAGDTQRIGGLDYLLIPFGNRITQDASGQTFNEPRYVRLAYKNSVVIDIQQIANKGAIHELLHAFGLYHISSDYGPNLYKNNKAQKFIYERETTNNIMDYFNQSGRAWNDPLSEWETYAWQWKQMVKSIRENAQSLDDEQC